MSDDAQPGANASDLRAVVDRLEDNGFAVLLVGDEETSIDFPVALLPADTTPGDHLRLNIERDASARDDAQDRTRDLLEQLESRTTPSGKKDFKL